MDTLSRQIICDGCGLPASPEHIAERLARLELATRFRPIHINMLLVTAAPLAGLENDFYRPPESQEVFASFWKSTGISIPEETRQTGEPNQGSNTARLVDFQRSGYYLSYLSECPLSQDDTVAAAIARLGPTLARRIRFNYKPKHVAILEQGLSPLVDILEHASLGQLLLRNAQRPETTSLNEARSMTSDHGGM